MRLWSLASFVAPLQLKVLAEKPTEEIIDETGESVFPLETCWNVHVGDIMRDK